MTELALTRLGSGTPLVLLHGLGLSRRTWDPVIPALAEHFDVVAIDLPGFGQSAQMPADVEPNPRALAAAVGEVLDELGIVSPHVAGNSLGGWVALELAHLRPVASITLLSPAGLWSRSTPLYNRISLRASRWLVVHARELLLRIVDHPLGRVLVLGQTHGRPSRMTPGQARAVISAMNAAAGFDATLRATAAVHYVARSRIDSPITVAFGSRDHLLLRRRSRDLAQLPQQTRVCALPGCGHVPMSDDPLAVLDVITTSTVRLAISGPAMPSVPPVRREAPVGTAHDLKAFFTVVDVGWG
jgi:pimeloyl-ACP methyl ester carboxylesterase